MSDLVEFLRARISEDEREAKSVIAEYEESPPSVYEMAQVPMLDAGDPERVLAECEAKRGLIEWAQGIERLRSIGDPDVTEWNPDLAVLLILASVYANHSDYREEWRP